MSVNDLLDHFGSIWYLSEPSEVIHQNKYLVETSFLKACYMTNNGPSYMISEKWFDSKYNSLLGNLCIYKQVHQAKGLTGTNPGINPTLETNRQFFKAYLVNFSKA